MFASAKLCPVELSHVVCSVFHSGNLEKVARFLWPTVTNLPPSLLAKSIVYGWTWNLGCYRTLIFKSILSCPVLWDSFSLVSPQDMDKVVGEVRSTTCMSRPWPAWFIKEAQSGLLDWFQLLINSGLSGVVPKCLNETVICPIWKKATLDINDFNNLPPVSDFYAF